MDHDVDVCMIGGGPGGYVAAIRAANLGLKIAVVEREALGGICLNWGCIPTKAMLRSADVMTTLQHAADYGIEVGDVRPDFKRVVSRRNAIVKQLVGGIGGLMKSNGITVVNGTARLLEPGTVSVSDGADATINAKNIVIATGSVPARVPIPGADGQNVIDSDGALRLEEIPSSMLVIGGGPVGLEWGDIFNSFGTEITLVELMPNLLPLEDEEMGRTLARSFQKRGITVHTDAKLEKIEDANDGKKVGTITLKDGKQEQVTADLVLIGIGRKPNTDGLGLDTIGVKTDSRGFVEIDDHLRTNVPGVYAIGDVTGKQLLAHLASHQGIVAAENIAGHEVVMDYKVVPACTYTHPEVATVGLSEKMAREQGHDVKVGRFPFSALGRAQTFGATEGMVKIVSDSKYGEILGVHIIGPGASDLIAEAALAIRLEATLEDLTATIHAHPTLPESIMEAAWVASGSPIHIPKPRESRG